MKFLKSGLIVGIGAILSAFLKSKGYVKSSVAVLGVSAVAAAAAYYIGTFAATPISVAPGDSGFLNSSITASQTSITISPITKWVNGVKVTGCFDSTEGVVLIQDGAGRKEYVYFPSKSCANNVTTLSSVTRGLNPKTTTGSLAGGTGLNFAAGSSIKVVDWVDYYTNSVYDNIQSTMTASGRVISDQTTQTWLTPTNVTTAQRDAFTDVRTGDIIFNTTTGTHQYYDGSSWSNAASGALVNATTAVRGAVTLSSTGSALIGSGQGIGGSFNVLQALYTTSGLTTVKAGYVPVTEDTGYLSGNLLGASPTATTFLRGDQTWTTPSYSLYGDGSDGALSVTSGTTTIDCLGLTKVTKQYTSITIATGATLTVSNPGSSGCILSLHSQGNVFLYGTINMASKGARGGSGAVSTVAGGTGTDNDNGSVGNNAFNNLGAVRYGGGGVGTNDGGNNCEGSGGGGGASVVTAGTAGTAADTSAGGAAGAVPTLAQSILAATGYGGTISVGAGGGGAGTCVEVDTSTGGAGHTCVGGDGGRGGGSLFMSIGGDFHFRGTVNLSGGSGENSSCSRTNPVSNYSLAAGGSGGGAAGVGLAVVAGEIYNSGTKTVAGGSVGNVASTANAHTATTGVGGAGAAGRFDIVPSFAN